jgi:hypothetical protein
MYAALGTRPDISFAVAALSRYNSAPTTIHMTAAKRVLRYLKHTANMKLRYKHRGGDGLYGFTDSDWAGDSSDRKSQGAYVFRNGDTAISWQSKKQELVALSTLEAEYMAFVEAARESLWLRQLHRDITEPIEDPNTWLQRFYNDALNEKASTILDDDIHPVTEFQVVPADELQHDDPHSQLSDYTATTIFSDNEGALKTVATEGAHRTRTKHVDIRYHASRNLQKMGLINFEYVPSAENTADALTKGLTAGTHWKMIGLLGLG